MTPSGILAAWLAVTGSGATTPNAPFVRSRTEKEATTGLCLWWSSAALPFTQSIPGSEDVAGEAEFTAVTNSFQTWESRGSACSAVDFAETARSPTRSVGYRQGGANENLVLFRERTCAEVVPANDDCQDDDSCGNKYDCWAYDLGTIGQTLTTYDVATGQVFDGDIELNGGRFYFTTVNGAPCPVSGVAQNCVSTDVANTMTHEIGHLLGLDHTLATGSTMQANADIGDTDKRAVDDGSKEFLCRAYPKGKTPRMCSESSDFVPAPCRVYPDGSAPADCTRTEEEEGGMCQASGGALAGLGWMGLLSLLRRRRRRSEG